MVLFSYAWVCTNDDWYFWWLEVALGSPGAGVKDGCVPPEAELWFPERVADALNPLAISPAPPLKSNIKMYTCLPFQGFTLPYLWLPVSDKSPELLHRKFRTKQSVIFKLLAVPSSTVGSPTVPSVYPGHESFLCPAYPLCTHYLPVSHLIKTLSKSLCNVSPPPKGKGQRQGHPRTDTGAHIMLQLHAKGQGMWG